MVQMQEKMEQDQLAMYKIQLEPMAIKYKN